MRLIYRTECIFFQTTMLAAGNFDFPANSLLTASVAGYAKRKPQPKWSHTEQQVHALHEWFRKHQVGWSVS